MRIKSTIAVAFMAVLILGNWPGSGALAQDGRTLTLGSLRLSSGEDSWFGTSPASDLLKYGAPCHTILSKRPFLSEPGYLSQQDFNAPDTFGSLNSSYMLNRKVGRVFNLSVMLSNIKQPVSTSSASAITAMSGRAGASGERARTNGTDLWALDVGLEYRNPSGHGVHLGYLYGTDPLTRELDADRPDKQGVDLGYSYDLDGFYVNLGYVYTFGQLWTGSREEISDSAFYLRFQLRF